MIFSLGFPAFPATRLKRFLSTLNVACKLKPGIDGDALRLREALKSRNPFEHRSLKKYTECFERLGTNGILLIVSDFPPFVLSASKDSERVFR